MKTLTDEGKRTRMHAYLLLLSYVWNTNTFVPAAIYSHKKLAIEDAQADHRVDDYRIEELPVNTLPSTGFHVGCDDLTKWVSDIDE